MSNYRLVPLLLICSKMFKKLINISSYFFIFWMETVCSASTNQASGLVTPVYISLQLLRITFLLFLTLICLQKFVAFFWIYSKPLIKFVIKILYTSSKIMEQMAILYVKFNQFCIADIKQLFEIVYPQNGKMLTLTVP